MATGFGLFFRLAYILGLTTILSFVWSWLNVRRLKVTVDRRSQRVRVGDEVEERLTIRNRSKVPKQLLEVEDLSDIPGYSNGRAVTLTAGGFRSWLSLAPARKRGIYTLGPVRVSNTDAFGLFRRERLFGGTDTLIVYPQTYDLPGYNVPSSNISGESSSRRRSHDLTPHAASVREYAFGDSISRIHWASSARMGRMMSKEFDLGLSSDVWLLVDLHRDVQAGELEDSTDEYAVSIAASLARKYIEAQLPAGLIAYGDQRYALPADTGGGQFDRIMEFLAMSKAEGSTPLEEVLPEEEQLWGYRSSLVVITSSHRAGWVSGLEELARRRVKVSVVLLDASSFGSMFDPLALVPELYAAGISPYVVRKGDAIPLALGRPYAMPATLPEAGS
ncbi:MAG: DUF58 domain-containing protein [SAR202 cluster bacterium]|mgnify:CR=1 FL=1|jgi:uncharacterized protein (DUF58 family)|nr:DUF58 domain-containing protein [SAR202 cluster bacterium]MDP7224420.1 DUF58 domain-containing protein [SAR202 cluster bacterium]|tara:strand:- start:1302 stop:2471 length:1170 start_codon:yes stop_codon:yes gene_type:complete